MEERVGGMISEQEFLRLKPQKMVRYNEPVFYIGGKEYQFGREHRKWGILVRLGPQEQAFTGRIIEPLAWLYPPEFPSLRQAKTQLYRYLQATRNPINLFEAFHGNPPARTRKVNLPVPKRGDRLIKIGRLYSVIYTPERPSQHYGKLFEHKLGDTGERMLRSKPILATDSHGENLYIIPDKAKPKFTKRGIIG